MKRELQGKSGASEIVIIERLSKEYGWTPNQIREMNISDVNGYMEIIATRNQLEEVRNKKFK